MLNLFLSEFSTASVWTDIINVLVKQSYDKLVSKVLDQKIYKIMCC